MEETVSKVQQYYDANVEKEWERINQRPEFDLTCRYLERYISPGDSVLDIGGGPGRYSLHLAQKGCRVTLLDLSPKNVEFGLAQAAEAGLAIQGVVGDARFADGQFTQTFDHILLMGPLYHLVEEADRAAAVRAALALLKPGGTIYISFISSHAGIIYLMKHAPQQLASTPEEAAAMQLVIEDRPFAGQGFTDNYFIRQGDVLPFMQQFAVEKLHLLGQESILAPCEKNILAQPAQVYERWLELAEALCERPEFLSWSEHLMYIGRKL